MSPTRRVTLPLDMDGLINLNKPAGLTSAKALYRVRKLTGVRKSGHAGTLDPAATGVLLICQGRATKLVEALMDLPKVYRAAARLDVTSASFDSDSPLEPVEVARRPTLGELEGACRRFEGWIEQVPPVISAVKVGGRPAYRWARSGKAPRLEPRRVHVYRLRLLRYAWPEIAFELTCGRGTYVRALIRDLGSVLGTGGCLTRLERAAVGPFRVEDAWTLERLAEAADPAEYLVPLERVRSWLARPGSGDRGKTPNAAE